MSRMLRALAAVLLALGASALLVVGVASPAAACSCAITPNASTADQAEQAYESADVVFVGRLTGREDSPPAADGTISSGDPATLTFAVTSVHKGYARVDEVIHTVRSGGTCGLELSGEGPFLVFAERGADGALSSSLCSGSTAHTELAVWPGSPPDGAVVSSLGPPGTPSAGVVRAAPVATETTPGDGGRTGRWVGLGAVAVLAFGGAGVAGWKARQTARS